MKPRALLPLVLTACAATPPAPTASPEGPALHETMQEHFVYLDDLEKAVIGGDLEQAKLSAQWVMDHHVEAKNPSWAPHLARLEAAAGVVVAAPDVAQAAVGAAKIAGACGTCHEAHGIDLSFGAPPVATGDDTRAHMKRHQWAADRLWDAVVGNSDAAWNEAAAALADAPLHLDDGEDLEAKAPSTDASLEVVQEAAEVVHRVGREGVAAKTREDRVRALGDFLSTCSACHVPLGVQER